MSVGAASVREASSNPPPPGLRRVTILELLQNAEALLAATSESARLDAEVLLEFARRMPFSAWVPPEPEHLDLRGISRRIAALVKTLQQEKNRLHAASQSAEMTSLVRRDVEVNIRHLERRIEHLRNQALTLIGQHGALLQAFELLVSIKGIAEASAVLANAETMLARFEKLYAEQSVSKQQLDDVLTGRDRAAATTARVCVASAGEEGNDDDRRRRQRTRRSFAARARGRCRDTR